MHCKRVKRGGSTDYINDVSGSGHPQWKADDIGYSAAHMRVTAINGPASGRICVTCGLAAKHWSYDHSDPKEKQSDYGAYSADIRHYDPRCVPCHKAFDLSL